MKRELTGILLIVLIMGACNHAPQEGTYHLRGIVTNEKLEGRTIYLQDAVKGTVRYDSATVSEGRFVFSGKINAPEVRELFIQETDSDRISPSLYPSSGTGRDQHKSRRHRTGGRHRTERGDEQTLVAIDRFKDRDFTGKEIKEIKEAFAGFVLEQIVKHAGSPVGKYLYKAYQNKLNEKQQAEARKTLGIG